MLVLSQSSAEVLNEAKRGSPLPWIVQRSSACALSDREGEHPSARFPFFFFFSLFFLLPFACEAGADRRRYRALGSSAAADEGWSLTCLDRAGRNWPIRSWAALGTPCAASLEGLVGDGQLHRSG
ncbi:hypothetical protein LZ32DRAFT_383076 [Colletotrichum eremochloae]|nr:hypothetical protein LZ32DRAFT_383076 [Colletotrichum eremochloae]